MDLERIVLNRPLPRDLTEVRELISTLTQFGFLWHFDDEVADCFPDLPRQDVEQLETYRDAIYEVCDRHGEDPIEICLDYLAKHEYE